MKRLVLAAMVLFFLCLFAPAEDIPLNVASVREVKDTYFGVTVTDPYRWMEENKDSEFDNWLKDQSLYAQEILLKIPGRKELFDRVRQLDDAGVVVYGVQRIEDQYFYYKVAAGESVPKLYVARGTTGSERLLVDPKDFEKEPGQGSIEYFNPSPNGKYVAVGISPGPNEDSVLYIVETATAKRLPDRIERARFANASWLSNSTSFFYTRMQKYPEEVPVTEKFLRSQVFLHELSADPEQEKPVFGYLQLESIQPNNLSFVLYSPGAPEVCFGIVTRFGRSEISLYTAPLKDVIAGKAQWQKSFDSDDRIIAFSAHGDELYLLSHQNAPRYTVLATSLSHPDVKNATVVIPQSQAVIRSIIAARDALYAQILDGGIGRLMRVPYGGKPQEVDLPYEGAILGWSADPRYDGVLFSLTSWTRPQLWFTYDPKTKKVTDTKLRPPHPADFSAMTSVEVKAKSYDGTMIPLSIIYRKDLKKDGANPTILAAFGASGVSQNPGFNPILLAWLERGGVFAVAHVRGGGEYGDEWHLAGMREAKSNSWKDFIACAEYLIEQKITSSAHLAGEGASAGGITVGRALTERPDLFAAIVTEVGLSNTLRLESAKDIPPNIPEFGTVKTEPGFKALYEMDSYHHVKDNTPYPAVLLTTGIHDPRFDAWQAGKMGARLQAATSSKKPVLIRAFFEQRALGTLRNQVDLEQADIWSFVLWQTGGLPAKN